MSCYFKKCWQSIFISAILNTGFVGHWPSSFRARVMDQQILALLKKSVGEFNAWRSANSGATIDLRGANLRGAKIKNINWPSPTMVLLAQWGELSNKLCKLAMRFDAANHPDPKSFNVWAQAQTGADPYSSYSWQRCCNFQEKRALWNTSLLKKTPPTALKLAQLLVKEKCIV